MFRFDPRPVFTATVTVNTPGRTDPEDFKARFLALPIDEFNAHDLTTEAGARAFLEKVIQGIDEIEDMDKRKIPDSPELRAALINAAHVRGPMIAAYIKDAAGAARGN